MICVSIAASTAATALAGAKEVEAKADVIEIRLDSQKDPEVRTFIGQLDRPLLFTNRPIWEGGGFVGAEEKRVELLLQAVQENAAYVDIELKTEGNLRDMVLTTARSTSTQVILSWHNFEETPGADILRQMVIDQQRAGAHIGKIVTMARNYLDVLRILDLQTLAARHQFPLIAFCMGKAGAISRLATLRLGGYMTYAAPDAGISTAPGQFPISELRSLLSRIPNES